MTTAAALVRMQVAVMRSDLEDRYIDFLNEAIHHLAVRHSWIQMKMDAELVIAAGERTIELPPDFKEFQNGRFPVVASFTDSSGSDSGDETEDLPIPVYSRQEIEHLVPMLRPELHLVHRQDNETWTISLPAPADIEYALTAYYYAFPGELGGGSGSDSGSGDVDETTPLLAEYPELVLEKALALAFAAVNDPVAVDHLKNFETALQPAIEEDIVRSTPAARRSKD